MDGWNDNNNNKMNLGRKNGKKKDEWKGEEKKMDEWKRNERGCMDGWKNIINNINDNKPERHMRGRNEKKRMNG